MLSLKLEIKKPRFWQSKWKIKKPTLYILEYFNGDWNNTYWWSGNSIKMGYIRFTGSAEAKIDGCGKSTYIIVGNTGTNLIVKNTQAKDAEINGFSGNKSGWVCFGAITPDMIFKEHKKYLSEEFGIKIEKSD